MTTRTLADKPRLRGHLHQAAFFVALGAGAMLLARTRSAQAFQGALLYVIGLASLFAVSALYHRPNWSKPARQIMRRLDHSMIFFMIAGSCTPICLLGMGGAAGTELLRLILAATVLGVLQSFFWSRAPKWFVALFCIGVGALSLPYFPELGRALGPSSFRMLWGGGALYGIGGLIYALKRPDPWPRTFGYHEIFHLLVMIAAAMHFVVIYRIVS